MSQQIRIAVGDLEVGGWLNETGTAAGVLGILPITGKVNLWGEEIYFAILLERGEENATETVAVGDIAYWPQGSAMCIFLGRTPISQGDEPRPVSPVNVIGRIAAQDATKLLGRVKQGDTITVRR